MDKIIRNFAIGLVVLIILAPLGLLAVGETFGEWSNGGDKREAWLCATWPGTALIALECPIAGLCLAWRRRVYDRSGGSVYSVGSDRRSSLRWSALLCGQEGRQRLAPPFFILSVISRSLLRGCAAVASLSFALLISSILFLGILRCMPWVCAASEFQLLSPSRLSSAPVFPVSAPLFVGGAGRISDNIVRGRLQLCIVPISPEMFKYSFSILALMNLTAMAEHDRSDSSGKLDSTSCGFNDGQTC